MSSIVWLASYPKSGNTWVRALIEGYYAAPNAEVNINALEVQMASSYNLLEDALGVEPLDELSAAEVERLRPTAYLALANRMSAPYFLKAHDAYRCLPDGTALFPQAATRAVIYIVRSPLDVTVSLAHHAGISADQSIARMCQRDYMLAPPKPMYMEQTPQVIGSWSQHVVSWLDAAPLPLHLLRYEDLLRDPMAVFGGALRFIGVDVDEARLRRAVELARFDRLQAQERSSGFREQSRVGTSPFFRRGVSGGWKTDLTDAQTRRMIEAHRDTMRRMNYLNHADELVE